MTEQQSGPFIRRISPEEMDRRISEAVKSRVAIPVGASVTLESFEAVGCNIQDGVGLSGEATAYLRVVWSGQGMASIMTEILRDEEGTK